MKKNVKKYKYLSFFIYLFFVLLIPKFVSAFYTDNPDRLGRGFAFAAIIFMLFYAMFYIFLVSIPIIILFFTKNNNRRKIIVLAIEFWIIIMNYFINYKSITPKLIIFLIFIATLIFCQKAYELLKKRKRLL